MLTQYNPTNERIKRRYFTYLREANRYSEATVDQVAQALDRFESETGRRDFRTHRAEMAVAFKKRLARRVSVVSGEKLSKATLHHTLAHLKRFFHWLAGQPGYRSRLNYSDADYFNLTTKETRIATTRREKPYPTLEQVRHVLFEMPAATEIERRNRAVVAFTLLTGARDSATASMKLKHVDLVHQKVFQDARDVNTKYSKSFTTYFFPVGGDVSQILSDWFSYLKDEILWGNEDPLFPSTAIAIAETGQLEALGLKREHWQTAAPIRAIFKGAFTSAGLAYFNPHSLRSTLVQLGEKLCRTPEDFKAWSQNLGHEGVLTTFRSYGAVGNRRQGEIIRDLASDRTAEVVVTEEAVMAVLRKLANSERA